MGVFGKLFKPRETAAQRREWIDGTMRAVANQVQARVMQDMRQASRSFETAETPAWTDSWPTHATELNDDLARQLPAIRARSRGLARNNEWARRYLIQIDDNVLGPVGIRLQMRLTTRDGKPDEVANQRAEAGWLRWGERGNCDTSGKLSWREIESLALGCLERDGELLYRLRPAAGPMGFQIQLLNPALLDVELRREWQGRRVRMGIEITDDGEPVAYWLRLARAGDAPSGLITVGRHVRIPANQIRHRYALDEIDQLRGVPGLTIGARRLWLLHDFEESAAVASSNAAKRQGFFVSPTGDAPPGFADTVISSVLDAAKVAGKVLTPDEIKAITAAAEKYSSTVPGQYDTLPTGYDFRPFESVWPNINADTYVKGQLRGWAAARGVSYVTLGNDLEGVNYSSARVGIIDEREHYKAVQGRLIGWLHEEVFAAALPYLAVSAGLSISRRAEYLAAVSWQPRRWAGIDPVKEASAAETNLRLKLTSRRRLILERGEDPDEIALEVEEEERRFGPLDANLVRPAASADDDEDAPKAKARHLHLAAARSLGD